MSTKEDSLPRKHTDPLWLQDFYVFTQGHDASTRSATGTFIRRKGRIYICTCRHILDALKDPSVVGKAKFPTLALGLGSGFINLSHMSADGVVPHMKAPQSQTQHEHTDIALCPIDEGTWGVILSQKPKLTIDLDNWKEPDWSKVRWGLAFGYPDEHKQDTTDEGRDVVANQLIGVVAELASSVSMSDPYVKLHSALDNPHSWYFSGLSGGPLYVVEGTEEREAEDDELFPAGIVFEGFPSTGREDALAGRDVASAFLTDSDLFIRAYRLTPEIFDEWVRDCGF